MILKEIGIITDYNNNFIERILWKFWYKMKTHEMTTMEIC